MVLLLLLIATVLGIGFIIFKLGWITLKLFILALPVILIIGLIAALLILLI